MNLNTLTLKQTIARLRSGEITLPDLYRDTEEAIAKRNKELNIYLSLDKQALEKAQRVTSAPFAGVPIAVKDNFLTEELPTTASANVLEGFMPPYESTVTKRVMDAGAVIIGKTNMDAWAHGSSTETSDFGPTKNPRNPKHLPGGSSGGSAAAVASDMCIFALGSETAGSIRQPAAWCGVVGLKPTYGRVSRYGVVAMGSSLDCPGPIGKTVEDCAMILNTIAGKDPYDATTADKKVPDFTEIIGKSIAGMRIGLCYIDHEKMKGSAAKEAVAEAGQILEKLGASISPVPLTDSLTDNSVLHPDFSIGVYTVVQRSEVSSNLARYDGIRYGKDRSCFGDEAKRRIMLGTFALSKGYADKYYGKAQAVRSLYIMNFRQLFTQYDALISPTSPGFALPLGASKGNPMFGELEDMLIEPSTIAGLPGISVPCFTDPKTKLSIGLDIVTDYWQEQKAVQIAHAYEQATEWNAWAKKIL